MKICINKNRLLLPVLIALTLALNPIAQAAGEMADAPGVPAQPVGQTNAPIPWDQIGVKAGADYHGGGLAVTPATDSARLHCVFQRLDGEATREGLWLVSTVTNTLPDRFQVKAAAIGRTEEKVAADLSTAGKVVVDGQNARFVRTDLTEEYSVSMDGVRQDFVMTKKLAGAGELRVRLDVSGAQVAQTAYGAQLILKQSGRKIAYSRLRVTDATGKELSARMEARTELAVVVNDAGAVYPVRIDPTFSDANWISMGGIPGVSWSVFAAVADTSGNLFIGGFFTAAGNINANAIARWNGSSWSALGSGMNNGNLSAVVRALAVSGTNLYAGGQFTTAGGVSATNIAQWNGSSWSALGPGLNNVVNFGVTALAVSGNLLYAGGDFTTAGGSPANSIAQWNGSSWSTLGSGMDNEVDALVVSGGTLYAGGNFTTAGGVAANSIAQWNGSSWSALGSGMNNEVDALVVSGGTLYAGGWFTTAGGNGANYIAQWNGSSWSALGSGMNNDVYALAVSGSMLYAGGAFTTAGGNGANYIAQWNGNSWSALNSGMENYVHALTVSSNTLYAGGYSTTAGGIGADYIAQWNGSAWSALGSGMNTGLNDSVLALAVSDNTLYVGGAFTSAGGSLVNCIAQWNGSNWSPLGLGLGGGDLAGPYVTALAVSGRKLYAGGDFNTAGGVSAASLAQWDGTNWSALGSGIAWPGFGNPNVQTLAMSGTNLYVGGYFTKAGGFSAMCIAQWNGSTWSALGSGMNNYVEALAASGGTLYAGGRFTTAGGSPANYIAQWNGSSWSALGSGMNNDVYALAVSGGTLYVGGVFTTAGGVSATNIAQWNGSSWSGLGSGMGLYGGVLVLAMSGGTLFAGGNFFTAGGVSANYIALWNGSNWSALGSGMNGGVNALVVSGGMLYAGGAFTTAGGKVSAYAAEAILSPPPALFIVTTNVGFGFANNQFQFTLTGPAGSNAVISASTNLHNWLPLATNPLAGGSLIFTDALATNFPSRFYRATLQP
jgi:hypothetical protein